MCKMCSFVAEAHEVLEVHEKVKHRFNVIYVRRCSQLQTETETEAHVKTDHSQTLYNCNKCHKTFNRKAFQEEHTERNPTNVGLLKRIVMHFH